MINLKRFVLFPAIAGCIALLAACSSSDGGIGYEVIAKSGSGDPGSLTNSAQHITDKEMLEMAATQTGAEIDADSINFDEEHIFQISLYENGCGYLLDDLVNKDGALQFMFELTPVVENGEDPEDVTCSETAAQTTYFVKTDAVDFSSLELYGSGEKIRSE